MSLNLPEGARFLVSVVLENDLQLRPGDEIQVTTGDGRLSVGTVASGPLDIAVPPAAARAETPR